MHRTEIENKISELEINLEQWNIVVVRDNASSPADFDINGFCEVMLRGFEKKRRLYDKWGGTERMILPEESSTSKF